MYLMAFGLHPKELSPIVGVDRKSQSGPKLAQTGKIDDQRIIFQADGCGDFVGNVLFGFNTIIAGIHRPVLTF